ncbi:divalent-cation tolerance protein CutA [Cupriavidus sp. AU9028]|uniref:divalent-cation tolerance protein CutA n=1 Tax=Cupriavidus sp. AU9028 TaxID=2871157 RepID=UPI001C93D0BB|nr:divalent-cation tolerance protein CutA [Cupriavidus sp. AU9028]MBY4898351.1 divalent-cation tolerance protein CutA [Cupriavidus sp. AU9028]
MTQAEPRDDDVLLVLTTVPDADTAATVARALLEARVAACVNRLAACESHYWWQGKLESASEWPLLIKTTRGRYLALEQALRAVHPYEVPELIAVPVLAGLPAYLGWVRDEVAPRNLDKE